MEVKGLIWLQNIVDKLEWKHHVRQDEVREIFADRPQFRLVEKGRRRGENVYTASGRTNAGRLLIVFFIYKQDRRALIISAREMTQTERRKYEKK